MGKELDYKVITGNLLLLIFFSASSTATNGDNPEVVCAGETCANSCQRNCSGQPLSVVCSSNGQTFDNMCEFEKLKCQRNTNWNIIYNERCVTLPPPPKDICRQHQKRVDNYSFEEYDRMCNSSDLMSKAENGTLELSDLTECYSPYCINSGTEYSKYQCINNVANWCWCSDTKGLAIEGTLEKSKESARCYNKSVCNYNGREYKDTQLFFPPDECGLCECLDGTVKCWSGYNPNNESKLNETQILRFINEVTQLFNLQYGRHAQTLIDIRHIRRYPSIISESRKTEVLQWKFEYYNRDNNDVLTANEQFCFRKDIESFLHCISFFDQIIKLMDANCDSRVTQLEWSQFFTNITVSCLESQITKRSVPSELLRRELSNRKKFYYVLA